MCPHLPVRVSLENEPRVSENELGFRVCIVSLDHSKTRERADRLSDLPCLDTTAGPQAPQWCPGKGRSVSPVSNQLGSASRTLILGSVCPHLPVRVSLENESRVYENELGFRVGYC